MKTARNSFIPKALVLFINTMEIYDTPDNVKNMLLSLDGKNIHELKFKTLSQCVRNFSYARFPLYIAYNTSRNQKYNVYTCSFHKPPELCESKIVYRVKDGNITLCNAKWSHNHNPNIIHLKRYRNRYSYEFINRIGLQAEMGLTPGMIRIKNICSIPSQHLYDISRKYRQVDRNEMLTAYNTIKTWPNWSNYLFTRDSICGSLFCFSLEVCRSHYSKDIVVVDDTSKTNKFELPLMIALSIDENNKSRLLGFGFLFGKSSTDYQLFFDYLKINIEGDIRLIISDRSPSQNMAYRTSFPNSQYLFCKIHIMRNVLRKLGRGEIYGLFEQIYKDSANEDQLLQALINESNTGNPKQKKFINTLLSHKEHWLPSFCNKTCHNDNLTSNRAEGFFGTLKVMILGQRLTISTVSTALKVIHDIPKETVSTHKLPQIIIDSEDDPRLGSTAKDYLQGEYNKISTTLDFNNCTCVKYYKLPCFHGILSGIKENTIPVLKIEDIPERYLTAQIQEPITPNSTVILNVESPKNDHSYNTYCAKFEKYFDVAHRNILIQKILNHALEDLNQIEIPSEQSIIRDPAYIANPGAKFIRPRHNVDLPGAKLKKKKYQCSICHIS